MKKAFRYVLAGLVCQEENCLVNALFENGVCNLWDICNAPKSKDNKLGKLS